MKRLKEKLRDIWSFTRKTWLLWILVVVVIGFWRIGKDGLEIISQKILTQEDVAEMISEATPQLETETTIIEKQISEEEVLRIVSDAVNSGMIIGKAVPGPNGLIYKIKQVEPKYYQSSIPEVSEEINKLRGEAVFKYSIEEIIEVLNYLLKKTKLLPEEETIELPKPNDGEIVTKA